MTTSWQWAAVALSAVNILSFVVVGIDKALARGSRKRISEKTLHLLALGGGFAGGGAAMLLFRHKTRKPSFLVVYVLVSLASATAIVSIGYRFS